MPNSKANWSEVREAPTQVGEACGLTLDGSRRELSPRLPAEGILNVAVKTEAEHLLRTACFTNNDPVLTLGVELVSKMSGGRLVVTESAEAAIRIAAETRRSADA